VEAPVLPPPSRARADDEHKEPTTQELDVGDFLTEPNVRVPPPSSGPFDDDRVAGVPRTLRPVSRWILLGAASLTAFVLLVAGFKVLRQEHEPNDPAAKRTAWPEGTPAGAATSPPSARAASLATTAVGAATAASSAAPPPAASIAAAATSAAPRAAAVQQAPAAAAAGQVVSQPRSAAAPAHAAPPQEAPVAVPDRAPESGGSVLAQASRALRDGSLVRAVDLARQAVNLSPGNADAWLTLGAAYQATGNPAAAHEAYRTCVEKARTANVGECRVLAEH
jgi:hypothetical protein